MYLNPPVFHFSRHTRIRLRSSGLRSWQNKMQCKLFLATNHQLSKASRTQRLISWVQKVVELVVCPLTAPAVQAMPAWVQKAPRGVWAVVPAHTNVRIAIKHSRPPSSSDSILLCIIMWGNIRASIVTSHSNNYHIYNNITGDTQVRYINYERFDYGTFYILYSS